MTLKYFIGLFTISIIVSCSMLSNQSTTKVSQTDTLIVIVYDTIRVDSTVVVDEIIEKDVVNRPPFQSAREKIVDVIHTTLDLKVDWMLEKIYGDAIIHVKPHFKSIDKIKLDALGLYINSIQIKTDSSLSPLKYSYDNRMLDIDLDCTFSRNDTIIIQINYSAIPSTLYERGITDNPYKQGLSFVKAEDTEDGIFPQAWSINQTTSASCWFPTIDSPNQRMTQDIYITVHNSLMALSNGELIYSTLTRKDSTRTFYWKLDKPQAPYLTSLNIGKFSKVSEKLKDVDIEYYVSKKYELEAKNIFGNTPEMIEFFSTLFKTPYPWKKYGQVAVSNYMYDGAMENNTLTIFHDFIQTNARERLDDNNEGIIAHELAHQWFGNAVTCEAWSNLTLNESFATYCEYLWLDYKYGKTEAEIRLNRIVNNYWNETNYFVSPTIQYHYNNSEWDVFNNHSYEKGASILHQLRKLLGDEIFFEATHQYLENNLYKSVNIYDLQKAFEQVSGQDLKMFFDQWYHQKGHPELSVLSRYDKVNKQLFVKIEQTQLKKENELFSFPVEIEIYLADGSMITKNIQIQNKEYIDTISVDAEPKIVRLNNEKAILAKVDYENYIIDYDLALEKFHSFFEKEFIIQSLSSKNISDSIKLNRLLILLNDDVWKVREQACYLLSQINLDSVSTQQKERMLNNLKVLAKKDFKSIVRAEAISCLEIFPFEFIKETLTESINDSSYLVVSKAFSQLFKNDYEATYKLSLSFQNDENFMDYLLDIYSKYGNENINEYFLKKIDSRNGNDKFHTIDFYGTYLQNLKNDSISEIAFDKIKAYAQSSSNWEIRRHSILLLSQIITFLAKNENTNKDDNLKIQLKEIITNEKEKRVLFGVQTN
ncbi:MAG TPA: hypothetical protein DDX39_02225 [Bacteroidales bacterium]|nr:MAG: hypothetical protein A2W98_08845 [Bacteroidetes bacterium GWF2_33_38]OFY84984.1 MAG: hypothetical protein A2236_03180 [Bacteroidetes bacterium RIFOXYA2_FULL_33_7]HBF87431.1 hypothetical protein [Bacteroidales bacterium]